MYPPVACSVGGGGGCDAILEPFVLVAEIGNGEPIIP